MISTPLQFVFDSSSRSSESHRASEDDFNASAICIRLFITIIRKSQDHGDFTWNLSVERILPFHQQN
ncbi:unnamed protein product [Larinioides sclopetarius]|uniref:Uncharacterized protein n=1 Tax=Larinioides sclopetarius TaxID=280406 RepID=A0AAV2ATT8_9ARAC